MSAPGQDLELVHEGEVNGFATYINHDSLGNIVIHQDSPYEHEVDTVVLDYAAVQAIINHHQEKTCAERAGSTVS